MEVQTYVSSRNENKTQIIKTYYTIHIIIVTYCKSFEKIWILFCGYRSFDVCISLLIQIQFIKLLHKCQFLQYPIWETPIQHEGQVLCIYHNFYFPHSMFFFLFFFFFWGSLLPSQTSCDKLIHYKSTKNKI